jgi:hypothetical protein
MLSVEAIEVAHATLSVQPDRHGHVQEDGKVRSQACSGETVQTGHGVGAESAPVALIGHGRVRETVAEHHGPFLQGRLDDFRDMLGANREEKQEFTAGSDALILGVQQNGPDLFADRRTAGLAGFDHQVAERPETAGELSKLRGLPAAFDPFEAQKKPSLETTTRHGRATSLRERKFDGAIIVQVIEK